MENIETLEKKNSSTEKQEEEEREERKQSRSNSLTPAQGTQVAQIVHPKDRENKDSPAPQNSPAAIQKQSKYLMMMEFMLEGCNTVELARVFNMSVNAAKQITGSELFRSGLAKLKEQKEFEIRAGLVGAAGEALQTVKMIMRQGKSEGTRLRASQFLLDVAGFHTSPSHGGGGGMGNSSINITQQTALGGFRNPNSAGIGGGVGNQAAISQSNVHVSIPIDIGQVVQQAMSVAERNRVSESREQGDRGEQGEVEVEIEGKRVEENNYKSSSPSKTISFTSENSDEQINSLLAELSD